MAAHDRSLAAKNRYITLARVKEVGFDIVVPAAVQASTRMFKSGRICVSKNHRPGRHELKLVPANGSSSKLGTRGRARASARKFRDN